MANIAVNFPSNRPIVGGNIVPNNEDWDTMWGTNYNWAGWLKPQIDHAAGLGLNCVRVIGDTKNVRFLVIVMPSYTFTCPLCSKLFRSDEPGEPCCTGPSESRDDHEMTVMRLLRIDRKEVTPQFGERRAAGALLMPDMVKEVNREALIIAHS